MGIVKRKGDAEEGEKWGRDVGLGRDKIGAASSGWHSKTLGHAVKL